MEWGKGICYIIGILLGFYIFTQVINNTIYDIKEDNENKLRELENKYCNNLGMKRVGYIGDSCGLFGCNEYQDFKCSDNINDIKIDYKDETFCEIQIRKTLGLC